MNILQKEDLAAAGFTNDNSNAAGGVAIRTDAGSTVGNAIAAAATPFATPAETIAGTVTGKAVDPAGLTARENIPAQTGLSNDVTAIPAPTAGQSTWGVNLLGETLHYMPGVGWKIVANLAHTEVTNSLGAAVQGSTNFATYVAPRAGMLLLSAYATSLTNQALNPSLSVALVLNGTTTLTQDRSNGAPVDAGTAVSASITIPVLAGDVIVASRYNRDVVASAFSINKLNTQYVA